MSVLKRVRDITVATLNDMLEKSEDPVRLIDQYIANRRQKIHEVEHLASQCLRHIDSVKYQYLNAMQMAEKRENQAAIAIKAGEESLARMALQEKILYEEQANGYKELMVQSEQSLEEAKLQLQKWQDELQEVLSKRHYYVSRLESMQLQEKFNAHLSQISNGKHAVRKLDDRLSEMEWEIRAKQSLNFGNELHFAEQKHHSQLDSDLEKLKEKMKREGK